VNNLAYSYKKQLKFSVRGVLCAGNDNLHLMTSNTRQRLRVDLADFGGDTAYAEYDNFTVESEQEKYRLESLGTYRGTAGQQSYFHN